MYKKDIMQQITTSSRASKSIVLRSERALFSRPFSTVPLRPVGWPRFWRPVSQQTSRRGQTPRLGVKPQPFPYPPLLARPEWQHRFPVEIARRRSLFKSLHTLIHVPPTFIWNTLSLIDTYVHAHAPSVNDKQTHCPCDTQTSQACQGMRAVAHANSLPCLQ